ncbi:MAG: tRNA (N(6)-L-threonylcarbamoyladenosine(37)-C(2))-methylthiotransferase [archaeon]
MKIFIRTFGCTLNQSDSEVMAGLLLEAGHIIVESADQAQIIIFNTCTVKDNPEKRFFFELEKARAAGKFVVVAGCVSQADPMNKKLIDISILGVDNISQIAEVVEEAIAGGVVRLIAHGKNPRLNLPKIRRNPAVEIIPICAGCLGECSYCKTRHARGSLVSYDPEAIKQQFKTAVKEGVKEIWLTSQDNGAYGKDIGLSLPELMKELLEIKGDYIVRIGMINPDHALEFIGGLIDILKHPRVFKFVHLPLQSGNDRILKMMNRKYSVADFVFLVKKLREAIPDITLATDVIVGFPSETDQEFEDTCALLEKLRIPVINITKFYPRPGTPAKKLKMLPNNVAKSRSLRLSMLYRKVITNAEWIGWQGEVIIDEMGKDGSWAGHNDYYKQVVIKNAKLSLGQKVMVKVVKAEQFYLEATPI